MAQNTPRPCSQHERDLFATEGQRAGERRQRQEIEDEGEGACLETHKYTRTNTSRRGANRGKGFWNNEQLGQRGPSLAGTLNGFGFIFDRIYKTEWMKGSMHLDFS